LACLLGRNWIWDSQNATFTGATEFNFLNSRQKGAPKVALSGLTLKQRKIDSVKIRGSELPTRERFKTWWSFNCLCKFTHLCWPIGIAHQRLRFSWQNGWLIWLYSRLYSL
jgi:hypothetical protein